MIEKPVVRALVERLVYNPPGDLEFAMEAAHCLQYEPESEIGNRFESTRGQLETDLDRALDDMVTELLESDDR